MSLTKRGPLTMAQAKERSIAGKASAEARHRAETSPSVKQGSTEPPSRQAIGLFRQGQSRPDTRSRRGPWDTRTTEAPVGSVNGTFTFHLPKAYQEAKPEKAAVGRKAMARALARVKGGPHQDVVVTNPDAVAMAQRHPKMRALVSQVAAVVRDHQVGAIEQGHARGLIPDGTRTGTIVRAYKHAALRAMHKAGLGDYDTNMDDAAKAEFTPLVPFMRYASRRVFDHLNQHALKGKWQPFRDEFGQLYRQKKYGKLTGHERMRMRPVDTFIKLDLSQLDLHEALAKIWNRKELDEAEQDGSEEDTHAPVDPKLGQTPSSEDLADPDSDAAPNQAQPGESGLNNTQPGESGLNNTQPGESGLNRAQPAPTGSRWTNFSLQQGFSSTSPAIPPGGKVGNLSSDAGGQPGGSGGPFDIANAAIAAGARGLSIPDPPGGIPPISGAASMQDQVQAVEDHFGIPPIGGSTAFDDATGLYRVQPRGDLTKQLIFEDKLLKQDYGFRLGSDFTTDPKRQLARAMRPRMRHSMVRLRLNPQRDLHRLLNGGVTRTERWELGAGGTPLGKAVENRNGQQSPTFMTIRQPSLGKRLDIDRALENLHRRRNGLPEIGKRLVTGQEVSAAARSTQIPTMAQAKAGNYQMGHLNLGGLDVSIETPKGRVRRGVGPDGKAWAVRMPAHYGYIKRTTGADGDHVDVYLGPHAEESSERPVHVVNQHDANTGKFDEHKAMLGFASRQQALDHYDAAFSDGRGPDRRKSVHTVTFADFKHWAGNGDTTVPMKKFMPLDEKNGHGHVTPRPDGIKARCGGPAICPTCAREWQAKYGAAFPAKQPLKKGVFGLTNRFARSLSPRAQIAGAGAVGLGAGLAIPHAKAALDNHPVLRGIAGAAAAGGIAALASRGRSIGMVRGASRNLYQTGLRDALREHARVMAGATPSPQMRAAARSAFVGAKKAALNNAKATRAAGMAGIRHSPKRIGLAAAAGGALGVASGPRYTAPPLYQLAAPQSDPS